MSSETVLGRSSSRIETLLSGWYLDGLVTCLSILMLTGIGLDARHHVEGISFAEEGFLTPEHAFFYTMFLGIAAVIGAATYRERRTGATWLDAVPDGYGWSVVGVVVFGLGGVGDFLWHSTFGFERGIETLLSPTHMLLAAGAMLFFASPLRASLRRAEQPRSLAVIPAVVSAGLVLGIVALFGGYLNPVARPMIWRESMRAVNVGISAFAAFPAILVGTAVVLVRRFDPPPGALALCFAVPAVVSVALGQVWVLAGAPILAGLVGDGLTVVAPPGEGRTRALRLFGAAVGLAFGAAYFALAATYYPIGWTVHVWTGAVVTSGVGGLLVTYAVCPDGAARD